MLEGILLIVLGILAVPSLLLKKRPDAKEILDKIAPYQGWIGLVFCALGILGVIRQLLHMNTMGIFPIVWLTNVAVYVLQTLLGFLLGYGVIKKLILAQSDEAKRKGEQFRRKLIPLQGRLGLAAIGVGVWCVLVDMTYHF